MRLTANSDHWSQPADWVALEREAQVPMEMATAQELADAVAVNWLPRRGQLPDAPATREKIAARQLRWPEMAAATQALMVTLRARSAGPAPWLPARRAERDCNWLIAEIGDLAQQVRREFRDAHRQKGATYDAAETQLIRHIVRAHVLEVLEWVPPAPKEAQTAKTREREPPTPKEAQVRKALGSVFPTPKERQAMQALVDRAQRAKPWLGARYGLGMSAEFRDGETLKLMIEVLSELLD